MQTIVAQGETIPAERLGSFEDHSALRGDAAALQAQLADGGYLYMREFLPRDDVLAARADIFSRLAEVGEILPPIVDGIYSGSSRRKEQVADLGAFWKSVCETWSLRRITHGPRLYGLMSAVFGEPVRAQDYLFLRPANRGKFTNLHCDYGFLHSHHRIGSDRLDRARRRAGQRGPAVRGRRLAPFRRHRRLAKGL